MKDSEVEWIGKIPYEWNINRLKYNIDCFDGKRIPIDSALREEGPYPYWGAGNITDYVNDYIFNEELVLLGEDGAPFFDEYRPVAFLVNEPIWVNNHIHVLKGKESVLNKFLTYFLNIVKYDVYINGSIINKLTQGNMNNINIPIPLIEEQRLIVEFLDIKVGKIDEILKILNKEVEILKKYKKSLITETVTKGLNSNVEMKYSRIKWLEKIPITWKRYKVKYSMKLLTDYDANGSFETIAKNVFPNTGDPYAWMVRATDLENNNFGISEVTNYCDEKTYKFLSKSSLKSGDLIMAKRGGIGNVYTLPKLISPATLAPNTYLLRFDNDTNTKFMYYLFKSDFGVEQLKLINKSTTIGAIYKEDVKSIEYAKPPTEEQEKIADYLDEKCAQIDEIIKDKQNQIDKMEKCKKSLIYEYVTGKKRVKGAEELYV